MENSESMLFGDECHKLAAYRLKTSLHAQGYLRNERIERPALTYYSTKMEDIVSFYVSKILQAVAWESCCNGEPVIEIEKMISRWKNGDSDTVRPDCVVRLQDTMEIFDLKTSTIPIETKWFEQLRHYADVEFEKHPGVKTARLTIVSPCAKNGSLVKSELYNAPEKQSPLAKYEDATKDWSFLTLYDAPATESQAKNLTAAGYSHPETWKNEIAWNMISDRKNKQRLPECLKPQNFNYELCEQAMLKRRKGL